MLPALKQADIGVAMGITGSESVQGTPRPWCSRDDNFATIVKAVENGRNLYRNIKSAIQFLLSGNFGAILAVLYASITALPVPFRAGAPAVHQPSDRQSAGDCPGIRAALAGSHG